MEDRIPNKFGIKPVSILRWLYALTFLPVAFLAHWLAPSINFITIPHYSTYHWTSPTSVFETKRYAINASS
jgi:hypothetical protein